MQTIVHHVMLANQDVQMVCLYGPTNPRIPIFKGLKLDVTFHFSSPNVNM